MGVISLIWGIVSLIAMLIAFIPLLGWGNWLVIPLAGVGLIFSVIAQALTGPRGRARAKTGLMLNAIALIAGAIRLSLGGGLL